ncbi:hypothetical protein EPIR_3500 [Erwinia piriflorinigrans CFBP 5888]|uniref:Uncharacterized protein n=1 Tax=Erwinia piriflorinigrans CFBP 5888 TaxID=1161919 RepID=V5ZBU1_9GAMM|nr:hypothetical protein EPIR_3500 [Erwinia piriflorinigrans CFBP 5888]
MNRLISGAEWMGEADKKAVLVFASLNACAASGYYG